MIASDNTDPADREREGIAPVPGVDKDIQPIPKLHCRPEDAMDAEREEFGT